MKALKVTVYEDGSWSDPYTRPYTRWWIPFFDTASSGITSISIPDSVTDIDGPVFSGCTALTELVIPNSVTNIGWSTFWGCSGLTSLTLPDSLQSIGDLAFANCTSLTNLTIPNSVTSIGGDSPSIDDGSFCGCNSLTSVSLGSGLKSIGADAFVGCYSLTQINVSTDNTAYKSEGGILFSKAQDVLVAFPNAMPMTTYTIPSSVTKIGDYAFQGCNLAAVTIPESVTDIGNSSFAYSSLATVSIPSSVASIGSAFHGCYDLASFAVASGNKRYMAQSGVLFSKTTSGLPENLVAFPAAKTDTSYTIPDGILGIEAYAFENCSGLNSVTIPSSVTSIGQSAFIGCNNLSKMTIPSSVTSIGQWAFAGCDGLSSATLGSGAINVGQQAFSGCGNLTNVTIGSSSIISGWRSFAGCEKLHSFFFLGLPPSPGDLDFFMYDLVMLNATVYYMPQYASSWPPFFNGLPTAAFKPSPKIDGLPTKNSNGFHFQWTGSANMPMNVQRATSLTGGTWSNVAAGITNGEFTDPSPPAGAAFYRAVIP